MKLVLFQTGGAAPQLPGVLTDCGVVDTSAVVRPNYTPQLVMEGIIDDFDRLRPTLARLVQDAPALPLSASAFARTAATAAQDPLRTRQLLGACAACAAPAQHVHEESGRRHRPGRHGPAARVNRSLDLHARGRTRTGHEGTGENGEERELARCRFRLHLLCGSAQANLGAQHLHGCGFNTSRSRQASPSTRCGCGQSAITMKANALNLKPQLPHAGCLTADTD